jgi:hypothetical protein
VKRNNQLVHGTAQTHDLAVRPALQPDQDWYVVASKPEASYEVVIDGMSGDIAGPPSGSPALVLISGNDGTTVLATSVPTVSGGFPYSRALRWANTTSVVDNQFVRVPAPSCGTACNADDIYGIRMRETTVNVARFNATGTQVTVVLTQNASERPVSATFFYWSAAGALLQTSTQTIAAKALTVVSVASFPALAGQGGHITVAHNGGSGALNVKAVAQEPATGFSFDTPGVTIP